MIKILLSIILTFEIFNCNAQNQMKNEQKIRSASKADFKQNMSKCNSKIDAVSDFNGKTELWNICNLDNGNRIITIESHQKETYYQEIYFEKKGSLIYAKETENYIPKNHFTQMTWSCEFYVKNEKLITLISLGHGKTEEDDWNPDVIFKMHKNRLTEFKLLKK